MSWDVLILNCGGKTQAGDVDEILQDGPPELLGSAADVRKRISKALPAVDWSDKTWGVYEGNGFTFEFNTGDDDPLDSVMIHVRGGGDAVKALLQMAVPNGWSLMDCSSSEFIDPNDPSNACWEEFQAFRDKALGNDAD